MRRFLPILLALSVAAPAHPQTQSSPKPSPKPANSKATTPPKDAPLVPLTQQERAQQLLNRFTFGPRPGDLEKVIALTPEKWFEQQLNPAAIPDAALDHRLADYTTLNLQPDQALQLFPDHFTIAITAEGKRPYPTDPSSSPCTRFRSTN
ncbi:DUF1800 family protein [Tunturiibacter gelidiferens]|uniref:DUF1800 family protein n=1 Tax=Tunturiibacter gelidiferens TaxID=3069689 RepID=UPI003D9AB676